MKEDTFKKTAGKEEDLTQEADTTIIIEEFQILDLALEIDPEIDQEIIQDQFLDLEDHIKEILRILQIVEDQKEATPNILTKKIIKAFPMKKTTPEKAVLELDKIVQIAAITTIITIPMGITSQMYP